MASESPDDRGIAEITTISQLGPRERKDLRRRGLLPMHHATEGYYRSQAQQIRALELRVAILERYRRGQTATQIAQDLGISRQKVQWCRKLALRESARRAAWVERYGGRPEDVPPRKGQPHLVVPVPRRPYVPRWPPKPLGPRPSRCPCERCAMRRALIAAAESDAPPPPPPPSSSSSSVSGEILDSPEAVQMRKDCLMLRKAMKPYDQMADFLGITEDEAREYTRQALEALQASDRTNADLERRLMIEQIDQMIAAIHPLSTGIDLQHGKRPVVLEAIDRMLKLMKQKAELLGLTEPPALDIRLKLQEMAAEGEYDIVDLEEIARSVLARHKIRLPEA